MKILTEEQKQYKREYNLRRYHERKNLATEKKRRAEYYINNQDHVKAKSIDNYHSNHDDRKEKHRQWKAERKAKSKTDVDQTFREMLASLKTRSKKLGRDCDIDLEYLHSLWDNQQGKCKLSNLPMSSEIGAKWKKVSPDRIDSSIGYIKGNIQLVLASVNTFKMDMDQAEFIDLCKAIANNN
jgi:hypothetical protein